MPHTNNIVAILRTARQISETRSVGDTGYRLVRRIIINDLIEGDKLPVPIDALNRARGLAHKLTHEADIRRINALVLELQEVQSTTNS